MNLAEKNDLTLIPVINKIDLPSARPDEVKEEIEEELAIDSDDVVLASAKQGIGIKEILEAIVEKISPPKDRSNEPLRALIFDSWFDTYLGAVALVKVVSGEIRQRQKMQFMSNSKSFEVLKVAKLTPKIVDYPKLSCGEVGIISGSIKTVSDTRVGDTITNPENPASEALSGFEDSHPMVFGGIFPIDSSEYQNLVDSLEKLKLKDASLVTEKESSNALGHGFRVGFLGLLHMDIIQERLEREYGLNLIFTAPSVVYHVFTVDGEELEVENPAKLPDPTKIDRIEEPYVKLSVHTPEEYIGAILTNLQERRGIQKDIDYMTKKRVVIHYEIPMNEIIFDFHDKLKSISRGYASMEYELYDYRAGDLVKLDILVNQNSVDALSSIVFRSYAASRGRVYCKKLKKFSTVICSRSLFKQLLEVKWWQEKLFPLLEKM